MMLTCLDRAGEFLAVETPKEFVQQIGAASLALQRSRLVSKGGKSGTDSDIDKLRLLLEPEGPR